eukprot:TRINITY_DN8421_c4_g1_i1.p4 TRINITY_DN8421_c4_g1~~TRINITY_DN8421_c4_g1_i1.p4  ORF type:complete len:107 (-),score=22.08 TRINITY_DN8421_c4_g1_i1:70-390(-)
MRVNQVMTPMDFPVISPASGRAILEEMAPPEAVQTFDRQKDSDFSYEIEGLGRKNRKKEEKKKKKKREKKGKRKKGKKRKKKKRKKKEKEKRMRERNQKKGRIKKK